MSCLLSSSYCDSIQFCYICIIQTEELGVKRISDKKGLTVSETASPLTFLVARLSFLRRHCSVVYLDVIDQAGPETAGLKILAGANVQAARRAGQSTLRTFGCLDAIYK